MDCTITVSMHKLTSDMYVWTVINYCTFVVL